MKVCHTLWEERVWKATLSAIQSSLMPRSLAPPLSALSDIIAKLVVRYEKASERWEIDLVQGIRRDIKIDNSLSNLIINIHRIRSRCFHFSSIFRKGLRQFHELIQRIQCLINIATIVRDEYCLLGLYLRCSRWWNQTYSEVADGACCKREEDMNKVHSRLNNSKS